MRVAVTGAAGFIGSHLTEALLGQGADVVGIDAFTDYYDTSSKRRNLAGITGSSRFELLELDLATTDVAAALDGSDVVFHLAGQPGVRSSWRSGFGDYLTANVLATQRVLEAAVERRIPRVVYASSSSVYGNAARYPTLESDLPEPVSPYGVTKLAGEHLCGVYAANFDLSVVSLRYFSVYGPRQRPDMALHRLIASALGGAPFPLFGDGSQRRDFTFVSDVVRASLLAGQADAAPGTVLNIGGGSDISVRELIGVVESALGRPVAVSTNPPSPGDAQRTGAAIELAADLLGWAPAVDVPAGVGAQAAWALAERST